MKYHKFFIILIVFVLISIVVRIIFFTSGVKVELRHQDIFVSTTTLKVTGNITVFSDGYYTIKSKLKEKNREVTLFPEETVMLRKNQNYKFFYDYILPSEIKSKKINYIFSVENVVNKRKKFLKQVRLKIPEISIPEITEIAEVTSVPEKEIQVVKVPPVETVDKEIKISSPVAELAVKKVKKTEPKFNIEIITENFRTEYFYEDMIQLQVKIKNDNTKVLTSTFNFVLKDNSGVVVSTKTYYFVTKPKEITESYLETKIPEVIPPGKYYVELTYFFNGQHKDFLTNLFVLIDKEPKITIPESPVIKYKSINTILVEVLDDRGVKIVQFVNVDPKKGTERSYQMILVAGDKKFGLYSYTTPVIDKKGVYKFYISAEDIVGNKVKTDIFNVIVK